MTTLMGGAMGSQRTPPWRKPDSNPRSPRPLRVHLSGHFARSLAEGWDAGAGSAVQPALFCSASHSMEPGAHRILGGGGLRCCLSSCARWRAHSK